MLKWLKRLFHIHNWEDSGFVFLCDKKCWSKQVCTVCGNKRLIQYQQECCSRCGQPYHLKWFRPQTYLRICTNPVCPNYTEDC